MICGVAMNLLLFRSVCSNNCVTVLSQYLQEAGHVHDSSAANASTSSEATLNLDGLTQCDDIKHPGRMRNWLETSWM